MEISRELLNAIQKAQEGKEEGFNLIYSYTYNYVFFKTKSIMKNEDEAWDLLQEVYVIAYKSISKLEKPENLYAWLGGIANNMGMKAFRKKKKNILLEEEDQMILENIQSTDKDIQPEAYVEDMQTTIIVKELIDQLPELQKAAVIAYYFDEMSVKDIAAQFECSEGTIKSRLNYARQYLRQSVEEKEKKDGIKLHSITIPTILLALRMLSQEVSVSARAAQAAYNGICSSLGLEASLINIGVVHATSLEGSAIPAAQTVGAGTKGTGLVAKFLSASTGAKMAAVGITAVLGVSTVLGGIAIHNSMSQNSVESSSNILTPAPLDEPLESATPSITGEVNSTDEPVSVDATNGTDETVSFEETNNSAEPLSTMELTQEENIYLGFLIEGITDSIEGNYKSGDTLTDEQKMWIAYRLLYRFPFIETQFGYERKDIEYQIPNSDDMAGFQAYIIPKEDIDLLLNTIIGNTISEDKDYPGLLYDNDTYYLYDNNILSRDHYNLFDFEIISTEIKDNRIIQELVRRVGYQASDGADIVQESSYRIEFEAVQPSKFGRFAVVSVDKLE